MTENIREEILKFQKNEITEFNIYTALLKRATGKNVNVLKCIAEDELKHYNEWKTYSKEDVKSDRFKILRYVCISRIFGVTFAIKLMERGEVEAENTYKKVEDQIPGSKSIVDDELNHEKLIYNMIEEEKLSYISSIVLGLNDALVEITGTIAGLTFALHNSKTVGVAGIITGIAASLSMAASEYLSRKSETEMKDPVKASVYTFIAYFTVVFFLVLPFFLINNILLSFALSITIGVFVIFFFSIFVSVVQDKKFSKNFLEMLLITGSVAVISFLIGVIARKIFHISV